MRLSVGFWCWFPYALWLPVDFWRWFFHANITTNKLVSGGHLSMQHGYQLVSEDGLAGLSWNAATQRFLKMICPWNVATYWFGAIIHPCNVATYKFLKLCCQSNVATKWFVKLFYQCLVGHPWNVPTCWFLMICPCSSLGCLLGFKISLSIYSDNWLVSQVALAMQYHYLLCLKLVCPFITGISFVHLLLVFLHPTEETKSYVSVLYCSLTARCKQQRMHLAATLW